MKKQIIASLREKYFNVPSDTVKLKKGEILMKQNQENRKLFVVTKGLVVGYWKNENEEKIEVFRSETNMLVGFHSFFSRTFSAYSEVIALEDSELAYLSYDDERVRPNEFLDDFVPLIVHELFERQVFAKNIMIEKEQILKNNYQKEKLATLGQMAAGLAHELNNAIGIINGNLEWIAQEICHYIKDTAETPEIFGYFQKGYKKGQPLSSLEVRKQKQEIEKQFNAFGIISKKLARLGLDNVEIEKLYTNNEELNELVNSMYYFWEMGVSIHDILLASKHATHVIDSVKALGVGERERTKTEINKTIKNALTLLSKQTNGVNIIFSEGELPTIQANETELAQIWINLVKNACESLKTSNTENPQVTIKTENKRNAIWISITDNGPGIPKKIRDKIFQPSFTTKKGGLSFGLGLGLAVVQKHVQEYNGEIKLRSKEGETTFQIKLPIL